MDYQPTLQIAANNAVGLDEALKAPSINVINIVTDGKLLLNIEDPPPTTANTIESAAILREKSAYFGKLLDLSKFSESVKFKEKLEMLGREHRHLKPSEIPARLLPNINISDVGQFPKGPILGLSYLHSPSPSSPSSPKIKCHRLSNLPYALPPQRFRKANPLPSDHTYGGTADEPFDATALCPLAPQDFGKKKERGGYREEVMKEDCLRCLVWIPAGLAGPPRGGWSVWVYLPPNTHNPVNLLGDTDLQSIIVMPVYRLNVFGFVASKELPQEGEDGSVSNIGFWDQRLALEWTYNNIAGFGGNKANITLGGLSAGAYSVFHQLAYELGLSEDQNIIKRVIMWSNGAGLQPKSLEEVHEQFEELIAVLGISPKLGAKDKLVNLRALPWKRLIGAVKKVRLKSFRAVTDGAFVRHSLFQEIEDGRFAKAIAKRGIKMMIGDLQDEVALYRLEGRPTSYNSLLARLNVDYTRAATGKLGDLYCPTRTLPPTLSWQDFFGLIYADIQVHMTLRGLLGSLSRELPLSHIHRYRINWRANCIDSLFPRKLGVVHTSDMAIWFFGNGSDLLEPEKKMIRTWLEPVSAFIRGEDEIRWGTKTIRETRAILADGSIGVIDDSSWENCQKIWRSLHREVNSSRL
ncbi:MAG: hypothetical protein MMC33_002927 [Icmadophila ericetorum]|nr:hypothetical protein [Icmadophila ericetorum]